MDLQSFVSLEQETQLNFLHSHGVCVAERTTATSNVFLYQLRSFYVEVFFDKTIEQIKSLSVFSSTHPLDAYLQQINISSLLKKILFLPFFELFEVVDTGFLNTII